MSIYYLNKNDIENPFDIIDEMLLYCENTINTNPIHEMVTLDPFKINIFIDRIKATFSKNKKIYLEKWSNIAKESSKELDEIEHHYVRKKSILPLYRECEFFYMIDTSMILHKKKFSPNYIGKIVYKENVVEKSSGELKKFYKEFSKNVLDYIINLPDIEKHRTWGTIYKCVKYAREHIATLNNFIDEYKDTLDSMEKSVDQLEKICNKEIDSEKIKWLKKIFKLQQKIYNHDTALLTHASYAVVYSVASVKRFIRKYSRKK